MSLSLSVLTGLVRRSMSNRSSFSSCSFKTKLDATIGFFVDLDIITPNSMDHKLYISLYATQKSSGHVRFE